MKSVPLTPDKVKSYDGVVISTDHRLTITSGSSTMPSS